MLTMYRAALWPVPPSWETKGIEGAPVQGTGGFFCITLFKYEETGQKDVIYLPSNSVVRSHKALSYGFILLLFLSNVKTFLIYLYV